MSYFLCFEHLTMDSAFSIDQGADLWFKNVSKNSLISDFDKLRTSQFTFTLDEIHRFANILDLKQKPTDEIKDEDTYCFVCEKTTEKCNKNFINGEVIDIKHEINFRFQ